MAIPSGPYLDFEKEVVNLEQKIEDLLQTAEFDQADIESLMKKRRDKLEKAYKSLDPWNRIELARRAGRPYTLDYIENCFTDFFELHGDRGFADDLSIVSGWAKLNEKPVMVIGQQKGKDTKENVKRNFGMPHPEGYRKALRLMKLAEKFNRPIITFIDTPGAYPGLGAEERGQGEAIARNLREMAILKVPVICVVIGEGASGGALGIGVGNKILMFENAWYSVISPEGCAAILWGDRSKAQELTPIMKLTAKDLMKQKVIDEIISEPVGGAHWDPAQVFLSLKESMTKHLNELQLLSPEQLIEQRIEKFAAIGEFQPEK